MRITGTFIDEITHDIPSNNFGREEWAREFALMRAVGIDTVILIRAGYRRTAAYPSRVLAERGLINPVYEDLVALFLELAEQHGMTFFFGTYDSVTRPERERTTAEHLELGRALVDEAYERYGSAHAFGGFYLTFEIARRDPVRLDCLRELGRHCKALAPKLPTLISPYIAGEKIASSPTDLAEHQADWDENLAALEGVIDIVAFQDGHVSYETLPHYLRVNSELIAKHGMRAWSNVESFDRDMPFDFPPIDFRKLCWKLDAAEAVHVEKLVTFEFSHFMSPQSCWPAAKNLFRRYCELHGIDWKRAESARL
jgi:hypothetical protein